MKKESIFIVRMNFNVRTLALNTIFMGSGLILQGEDKTSGGLGAHRAPSFFVSLHWC